MKNIYIFAGYDFFTNKPKMYSIINYGLIIKRNFNLQLTVIGISIENKILQQYHEIDNIIELSTSDKILSLYDCAICISNIFKNGIILFLNNDNDIYIANVLSGISNSTKISNICSLPESIDPFIINRECFCSRVIEKIKVLNNKIILNLSSHKNYKIENYSKLDKVKSINKLLKINIPQNKRIKYIYRKKIQEIDNSKIIIGCGRGIKNQETFNLIKIFSKKISASLACTKPISDSKWGKDMQHVGQTGKKISPYIYIAIGISGAIQHMTGVNNSKIIIAINNDVKAPIFKLCDYGIVGDAYNILKNIIHKF